MYGTIYVWKTMVSGSNMVRWNDNRRRAYLSAFSGFSSYVPVLYVYFLCLYLFLFARVSLSVSVIIVLLSFFLIFSLIVIYVNSETLLCIVPPYKEFYLPAKYDFKTLPLPPHHG
jgi:hypothetical protein